MAKRYSLTAGNQWSLTVQSKGLTDQKSICVMIFFGKNIVFRSSSNVWRSFITLELRLIIDQTAIYMTLGAQRYDRIKNWDGIVPNFSSQLKISNIFSLYVSSPYITLRYLDRLVPRVS